MTHYFKDENGNSYKIDMNCSHPDLENNSSESIRCDGKCEDCSYGIATMSIRECLKMIDAAGLTK